MGAAAIIGIAGQRLTPDERALLREHCPRGVILFGRNVVEPSQLAELVGEIRNALGLDGLLMVDQEGGRVARLRPPHWPSLPPAGALATEAEARAHGRALGAMAKAAGFDVVTAPVLDLRLPGASDVIGDRSFGADPATVGRLGGALAAGLMDQQIIPVMKHIPGHGRAAVDSHLHPPVVTAADLADDFAPFIANRRLPWAMTAHVTYTALDPDNPATLSATIIREVIRTRIGFTGTLVSDDLAMQALSGPPEARARAALAAGCDIALYCPGDFAANRAVLEAAQLHAGQLHAV